ncbi:MAG TPA: MFS transporter [Chthoniobacterales bacterium]|nr:MFS transporter [Chthoniobacterales bacterium]
MDPLPIQTERLLRHPSFILFWVSRIFSVLGFQVASVAVGWLVYAKTGSAYALGLVGLFQFLPMVALTFLVGHIADRLDRRRIVATCQCFECIVIALLTLSDRDGRLDVTVLFAAVALLGAARAFESPTMSALLPALVPEALLPKAFAVSSSAMQTATIVGPSLGGLLYAAGASVPLAVSALCLLAASGAMAFLRTERIPPKREPVSFQSVFSGVSFIRRRPIILGAISLDLFAVLFGGVTALLPIFARDILHTGPWGLGFLRSAPAAGALAMSILLVHIPMNRHVGIKMFAAVMVFGIATVIFSISTSLTISLVALVILGAADNVSVVIRVSLVQLSTPDSMRGRVSAVNSLFIGTSNQLGEFESGMVAGLLGVIPSGIVGGIATILIALLWMRLFPDLRSIDTLPNAPKQTA